MMRPRIIEKSRVVGLVLSLLLFCPVASQAKSLYVDANAGNDSTTWAANGPSSPWRTIGRAAWGSTVRSSPNPSEAARAGDTVIIAAGIYTSALGTGGGRWEVLYNPANSGTVGNPVSFVASGVVSIRAPSWGGPVIGASSRNYIQWRGPFYLDETQILTVPDTGPVVLVASIGSGIDGATIHGNGAPWGDNHNGVRIENTSGVFIRNTAIDNFYAQAGSTRNGSAVTMYNADDTLIENNEFSNCATGIYVKGVTDGTPMERTVIRYNIIRATEMGINLQRSRGGRIYQNIMHGNAFAFRVGGGTADAILRPVNDIIANNTIDGAGTGMGVYYGGQADSVRFRNNIWVNMVQAHISDSNQNPFGTSHENNVYHDVAGAFANFIGTNYTFATWRSTFRHDQAAEPASSMSDPRFVNEAGQNYRLQATSPARAQGVDLLDLDGDQSTTEVIPAGAYITGTETIGVGAVRPEPPSQVTIE